MAKDANFRSPELINKYNVPVVFTSSDQEVAAVDPETGVVTVGKAGSVTIEATFEGSEMYKAGYASYKLIVKYLDPELWFSDTEVDVMVGVEAFQSPVLHNPYKLSVVYSSSDESLAVVDEEGEVTLGSEPGTVTITATYEGDDYFEAGEASYDIVLEKGDTGISTLTDKQSMDGKWYTIQGVRVDNPAKGLYIYRGKKVVK